VITTDIPLSLADILSAEPAIVTQERLHEAQEAVAGSGSRLFAGLIAAGLVSEQRLLEVLSERLGLQRADLLSCRPSAEVLNLIPVELAVRRCCIPLRIEGSRLDVAVNDPTDHQLIDDVRLVLLAQRNGRALDAMFCLAGREDILQAIKENYGVGAEAAERLVTQAATAQLPDETTVAEQEDLVDIKTDGESSVVQFVNLLLIEGVRSRATDIHIEPFEERLRIRQRIDGMLYEIPIPAAMKDYSGNIASRIKVMAQLDIAEKRLPQDGRIKVRIDGKEYDLRISVLPSPHGEAVNIRILSQHMRLMTLDQLGLDIQGKPVVENLIERPNGVILVTGPTGSGKTTFLYACLSRINAVDRKILTIEDPIEYRMDGVVQMQTLAKIDFSFARALRSMLRHDPDIMMIGEIRDAETAQITIRSALTGHLVLSTLHTNDAAGAIARLVDMGMEPFLVASSLLAVLAIRLVRVLCPHCRQPVEVKPSLLEQVGVAEGDCKVDRIYDPAGCPQCRHTGFAGRTGIFEILRVTEPIRDLIQRRVTTGTLKAAAVAAGMKTLRQDGWKKVSAGITSLSEVLRVSHADEFVGSGKQASEKS
jgi:type II secretory ATPase GspE/PulE/Tfp pilus assembly ATPase PilB-like protein